ncbi:hypothetical protein QQ045_027137 [Rhodiola kirilowii]
MASLFNSPARMKPWLPLGAFSTAKLAFCLFWVVLTLVPAAAQTTDPSDAAALNAVFAAWRISAGTMGWNVSGEICSGTATDSTISFDNPLYNPFVKCDCNFNNGSSCRIAQLKVYAMDDVSGPIPDALWNLTYLSNLNIGQNYLTGSLSPSIGNLTRMQYLSLGINALSGQLPKELGLLTDLRSLAFGTNNFSGPLPSELGNLVKMDQIYFDSAGVSGQIPETFRSLQSLITVWASDNDLNGTIPEFIGNWTALTTLRLQGNNFQGSIPSSFSNLTAMQDLRISDIANGRSSLAFIRNMKSLNSLVLRNNNISDTIPSNIGDFQRLSLLDLSFNNISSQIPAPLFNLSSLSHLFLGNNRLTGSLPALKTSSLVNIDLSYNYLSGSFPSWVSNSIQLNLVSNNFTIGGSNSSALPAGLECLQRNFPCNRGTGIYSDFAIKCGGSQIRSSSNVVFESDREALGPATHFMTASKRWAVSNVGRFADNNNASYIAFLSSQFTNTLDSELFQTARISPGSLRYYGLGLENGNYTISLQFAETVMVETTRSWKSLGRRRFDVYIQGIQVLKNFDILKEAGGVATSAVKRDFRALVTENFIDIHLFWAGKGTCCVPNQGTFGPLISAISATPNFVPTVANKVPSSKSNNTGMIVGIVVGVAVVLIFFVLAVFCFIKRRYSGETDDEELELLGANARPNTFTYSELRTATEDFSPANKLGEGGFGPVYKGILNDGRVIAVKQLSAGSHQGKTQFYTEIATISAVQHRNLVKLYGCCVDGTRRMLVYEYLEKNSLDQALFGGTSLELNWENRFNICMGIARGLTYLHEESQIRIVHRDVKASNILLDAQLNPKISDFGLAKLYDDKMTHISTNIAGTIGYLAPEYAMRGHLTEKADIFGFGVVALEIVSGRPNTATYLEEDKVYLMEWAWQMHESSRDLDLVDPRLSSDFNAEEVKRVIGIALLCTQTSPSMRPSMSRVVAMLSGDTEVPPVLSKPMYLTDWNFTDSSTLMSGISTNEKQSKTSNYSEDISTDTPAAYPSQKDDFLGEGR